MNDSSRLATANLVNLSDTDRAFLNERTVYLALSGGIDSVVLCHLLHSSGITFSAIHINHQIHKDADRWEAFCRTYCQSLSVPFLSKTVSISGTNNLEAKARQARYNAINELITDNAVVCFAHHQGDIAETLLLQLKRGSGLNGLTSLRKHREMHLFNKPWEAFRPLLSLSKELLLSYAQNNGLHWVEDPSNTNQAFDRNFMRHNVLGPLKQHWKHIEQNFARSVATLEREHDLLNAACEEKLALCLSTAKVLLITPWLELPDIWRPQILRYFLMTHHQINPSQNQLKEIIQLCVAKEDAQGEQTIDDKIIRRFRNSLYVDTICPALSFKYSFSKHPAPNSGMSDVAMRMPFTSSISLPMPEVVAPDEAIEIVEVALSYRVKPLDANHTKPLKQWLKHYDVPPWQRMPVYLVRVDGNDQALFNAFFALVLTPQNTHSIDIKFQ